MGFIFVGDKLLNVTMVSYTHAPFHRVVQILTNPFPLRTVHDSFHSHGSSSFLNRPFRASPSVWS